MNHHYIEYMIRERRREEIEAYSRLRMLKREGYLDPAFLQRFIIAVIRELKLWKERVLHAGKSLLRFFSFRNLMINQKDGVA